MPISAIQPRKPAASETVISCGSIVQYEQHGRGILAIAISEHKGKWKIVNGEGAELNLQAARLYLLPGSVPQSCDSLAKRTQFLKELEASVATLIAATDLEEVWSTVCDVVREYSVKELTEIAFIDNALEHHLAFRQILLADTIFFKRKKVGYEPRPIAVIDELKQQANAENEKKRRQLILKEALIARAKDHSLVMPEEIYDIEKIAALGKSAPKAKEYLPILDSVLEELGQKTDGAPEQRIFHFLQSIGHFSKHQNLSAIRLDRTERFDPALMTAAREVAASSADPLASVRQDLRHVPMYTIDDASTKDMDDALSIESTPKGYRIGIHISDVAAQIAEGSPLEQEAFRRGTSIYFPEGRIPMFPAAVSEGNFSLFPQVERLATSFFIDVDDEWRVLARSVVPSRICVQERLTYEAVDRSLFDDDPQFSQNIREQLLLLWDATCVFESRRLAAGALQFQRREMNAVVDDHFHVSLQLPEFDTPAHKLVGEMMILANETAALFAAEHGIPLVFRSQEPPDVPIESQCLHIPEGIARDFCQRSFLKRSSVQARPGVHFGLGLTAYAQLSSPIRRAMDLINQRQLNNYLLTGKPYYTEDEVSALIALIEASVSEAMQLQRERSRYWLLQYLKQENFKELSGIVTRTDGMKPLAELEVVGFIAPFQPLHPKKNPGDPSSVKAGDVIKLRIERLNPHADQLRLTQSAD